MLVLWFVGEAINAVFAQAYVLFYRNYVFILPVKDRVERIISILIGHDNTHHLHFAWACYSITLNIALAQWFSFARDVLGFDCHRKGALSVVGNQDLVNILVSLARFFSLLDQANDFLEYPIRFSNIFSKIKLLFSFLNWTNVKQLCLNIKVGFSISLLCYFNKVLRQLFKLILLLFGECIVDSPDLFFFELLCMLPFIFSLVYEPYIGLEDLSRSQLLPPLER